MTAKGRSTQARPATRADDAWVDGVDVDAVAAAVRRCRGVDDLVSGPPAMASTYVPGRRITGVRVEDEAVTVQVRARWGATLAQLDRQVHNAVGRLVTDRPVEIVVADVTDPSPARRTATGR